MLSNDFEKKVQQKMEELSFTPGDAVWDKIEAGLPKDKKQRRFIFFLLVFLVLSCGTFLLWDHFKGAENLVTKTNQQEQLAAKKDALPPAAKPSEPIKNEAALNKEQITPPNERTDGTDRTMNVKTINKTVAPPQAAYTINEEQATAIEKNSSANSGILTGTKKTGSIENSADVAIVNPGTKAAEETITNSEDSTTLLSIAEPQKNTGPRGDPPDKNTDTIAHSAVAITKEKKTVKKWTYGLHLAAGVSNVKSGLFTSQAVYADAITNSQGSGTPPASSFIPGNPSAAMAFEAGFFVEKKIRKNWVFNMGLHYSYQSNKISVGSKVDSVISLAFSSNNVRADNYYRNGGSVDYTNKFHLLQIPLQFQYRFLKKLPAYLEAGPAISYLVHTNTLQYNNNSAAYFTNASIFNKFLLSVNTGGGFDFTKHKAFPFSIGYRFSYSPSSVTKKTYGRQHLLTSQLYVNIPLNK